MYKAQKTKNGLLTALVASALMSASAYAQLADDPNNNATNITGTSAIEGGVGAVLNTFTPGVAGVTSVGLENDGNGDLLTTAIGSDEIYTQSTAGALVSGPTSVAPEAGNPIGITTDGTNLYITDTTNDDVDIFTAAGAYVSSFDVSAFSTFPEGITYAPFDGNLYVVNGSGSDIVGAFTTDGTAGATFPVNGSSQDGIAWDNLRCQFWLYDSGTDTVTAYDSTFTASTTFAGTGAAGFGGGEGLAVVGDSLFVLATGSDTVVEFDITDAPPADNANELCPPEAADEARFAVNKDFDDNNEASVEVTLSCNTGLPLEQTTTIEEGDGVNFIVGDFEQGELNCEVTETAVDGYSTSYNNGEVVSLESCAYVDLIGAQYTCDITNTLDLVSVEVTKEWVDDNPGFNPINVADAEWECDNVAFGADEGNLDFYTEGDTATDSFTVYPDWDTGTSCDIVEVGLPDGGIEVDASNCQNITLFPGDSAACTIVNTRLYEGIPTLSQYGLAVLALLMLGMGFVGFRRFV